jgi:hypothetical protein
MLMGTHNGGIHQTRVLVPVPLSIGPGLKGPQDPLPNSALLPAIEAAGHRAPRTVALGQSALGRTRA